MCEPAHWIDRRSIPAHGSEVHAFDVGDCALAITFRDSLIGGRAIFATMAKAIPYASIRANQNRHALIPHITWDARR